MQDVFFKFDKSRESDGAFNIEACLLLTSIIERSLGMNTIIKTFYVPPVIKFVSFEAGRNVYPFLSLAYSLETKARWTSRNKAN